MTLGEFFDPLDAGDVVPVWQNKEIRRDTIVEYPTMDDDRQTRIMLYFKGGHVSAWMPLGSAWVCQEQPI